MIKFDVSKKKEKKTKSSAFQKATIKIDLLSKSSEVTVSDVTRLPVEKCGQNYTLSKKMAA